MTLKTFNFLERLTVIFMFYSVSGNANSMLENIMYPFVYDGRFNVKFFKYKNLHSIFCMKLFIELKTLIHLQIYEVILQYYLRAVL
jgi:hypothetical protein